VIEMTMSHEEVSARILDLIEDITDDPEVRRHLDEDLFELGFLDSMAAIELLVGLEEELGVEIAPTEVQRNEMNTVNKIIAQVEKRL
jgi:D-alanine--poly(phosphoribitol) ligase subunit 2